MEKSVYTPEYSALRAQLRSVRESAGFSQRELASRLRVPHSWVAKVESGERRIDLVEFCWFAKACAADPVAILEGLAGDARASRPRRKSKEGRPK